MPTEEQPKPKLTVIDSTSPPGDQLKTIEMLVNALDSVDAVNKVRLLRSVQVREMSSSTYIGHGLAIPHARMEEIDDLSISIGYFPDGIDWPDAESKAELVVLLAVPHTYVQAYLVFMKKFMAWYSHMDSAELKVRWNKAGQLKEDIGTLLGL